MTENGNKRTELATITKTQGELVHLPDRAVAVNMPQADAIQVASVCFQPLNFVGLLFSGLLPIQLACITSLFCSGSLSAAVRGNAEKAVRTAIDKSGKELETDIRSLQEEKYKKKQLQLAVLADMHIARGEPLDEKTLSYLAALPPSALKDASDQLAITVMQARQMLAYERDGQRRENMKPETFARNRLSPAVAEHRRALRNALAAAAGDVSLKEDEGPETWPAPEIVLPDPDTIPEIAKLKVSKTSFALRVVAAPLFLIPDWLRIRAARNAKLPDIEAKFQEPALRAAEDFSAALARYERDGDRLDLPALRGWGGAGPGRLLPGKTYAAPRPLFN